MAKEDKKGGKGEKEEKKGGDGTENKCKPTKLCQSKMTLRPALERTTVLHHSE